MRAGRRPAGEPVTAPILTVAEAFEAAIARGDLPLHWGDPARAPLWWCPACRGTGRRAVPGITLPAPCGPCGGLAPLPPAHRTFSGGSRVGYGYTPLPPDVAALGAVVDFGAEHLLKVERLVDVVQPGARVMWRVGNLGDLLPQWQKDRDHAFAMRRLAASAETAARAELMEIGAWPCGPIWAVNRVELVVVGKPTQS